VVGSWTARRAAYRARTLASQYFPLIVYVIAKTIIFIPMLYLADSVAPGVIQNAAQFTVLGAAGLTWVAVSTCKDFSFLRATL